MGIIVIACIVKQGGNTKIRKFNAEWSYCLLQYMLNTGQYKTKNKQN